VLPRAPTILVVDDTDVVRKSAARCLRRRGYRVIEASSADEALLVLDAEGAELDMILADLVLPTMCGIELVAEARRRFPALATAYMTGHLGKSARCEESPDSATPLLLKPFTPHVLDEHVREALLQSGWTSVSDPDAAGLDTSRYGSH
jgi:two-component system, cell cycle sensor histidine kinase and response regulator CckA